MIKLTIINILGKPNDILDLKKGFDKALKNIPADGLLRLPGSEWELHWPPKQ